MNPHVRLERFRERLIGADKKPIMVRGTTLVPVRISKKTNLRCVSVENLSMKLIIGFPGLRDLGLSMDLKHIGEMGRELTEKRDIEVNVNKNLKEKQQDQLEKKQTGGKEYWLGRSKTMVQLWDTNLQITREIQSPFMSH